jgi:hypothetical protein
VGSKTYEGVRFSVFSHDHLPPHVHGSTEGVIVILDLLADGSVSLSQRRDAIKPSNAKANVVAKIQRVAASHAAELSALWEKTHGTP